MSERRRRLVKVVMALREKTALSALCILGVSAIRLVIFRVNSCDFVDRLLCPLKERSTNQHETEPKQNRTSLRVKPVAFLLLSSLLTSCSRAPSFDILGSYFPAWLVCLTLGVVLTVVIRWLLLRLQIEVLFPIVVYPSLTAVCAFGMWLVFYG